MGSFLNERKQKEKKIFLNEHRTKWTENTNKLNENADTSQRSLVLTRKIFQIVEATYDAIRTDGAYVHTGTLFQIENNR